MTSIFRNKDTVYCDKRVLLATSCGGVIQDIEQCKLMKHPNFPVVVGVSGNVTELLFSEIYNYLNQVFTEIYIENKYPTLDISQIDASLNGCNFTLITAADDYSFVIYTQRGRLYGFKYSADIPLLIGSSSSTIKVFDNPDINNDINQMLKRISARDGYTSSDWFCCQIPANKKVVV